MSSQEFTEKLQKFRDAIQFKKTKTAPNLSFVDSWQFYDSSYTFKECFYDYEKRKDAIREFHNRYNFDAYVETSARNAYPFTDALGGGGYQLNIETGGVNVIDKPVIFPEDYEEYAKDPVKTVRKVFQRKYPNITTPMFRDAILQFLPFGQYGIEIRKVFEDEFHRPLLHDLKKLISSPIEMLNSGWRGVKGVPLDIRRHKDQLKVFLEAHWQMTGRPALKKILEDDNQTVITDSYISLLAHSFMSVSQFAELYWPYMKEAIDAIVAAGKTVCINCENTLLRFAEFFEEIPKGTAVVEIEMDDIFEVRKRLPNLCLAGGMKVELLGYGTPQQCVDYAKKLIDEMGPGFILSQNKMVSFPNDCRRENLLAVNEFVRNYQIA
jgi:hypothetical protein